MLRRLLPILAFACLAAAPAAPSQPGTKVGIWIAPEGLSQLPIWTGQVPDMDTSVPPESVLTARTPEAVGGTTSQAIFNVSVPTVTIYSPKGRNTRAAVIVMPGGGFNAVVVTLEGTEICDWLAAKGLTCIILKYRVPKTGHHWEDGCKGGVTPKVPRALQDAQRAIRLVRSKAKQLDIDPNKVGVMGFSAGGYLVAQTSNIVAPAYRPTDVIDRVSSRPDFAIALYPGHLCRTGAKLDPQIHVTKRTPPTFLLQAWDDPVDDVCNSTLYARALDAAGVPSEVHLFATGGHAFALRHPHDPPGIWPTLVERWLKHIGIL
jgi:acetyl esterase/lipase